MDMDQKLNPQYADGIECDRFAILTDSAERHTVALHEINVDILSKIIMDNDQLLTAGILAKAKREIVEIARKSEAKERLGRLLGME